jgi:hypothetical protein
MQLSHLSGPVRTKLSPAAKWREQLLSSCVLRRLQALGARRHEVAGQRPACNPQAIADMLDGDGARLVELERQGKGLAVNGLRPAATLAPTAGAGEAGQGPFPQEMPFEFRQRARHLQKERASGRGGINRLDHAVESELSAVTRVQQGDQVSQGTASPIAAPYHQGIPSAELCQGRREGWSRAVGPPGDVLDYLGTATRFQRLQVERHMLGCRRDSRLAHPQRWRLHVPTPLPGCVV